MIFRTSCRTEPASSAATLWGTTTRETAVAIATANHPIPLCLIDTLRSAHGPLAVPWPKTAWDDDTRPLRADYAPVKFTPLREGVADHFALDHVDHHLRDVGRVVGHALEEARDQDQPDRPRNGLRVRHHVGQQLAEDLLLQRVHLGVLGADLARQLGVPTDEGVQALLDHALGPLGHPRQVDVRLELRFLVQLERALGDVYRLVADPLEVGHDFHDRSNEAEVPRRRLVEGEQL